MTVEIWHNPRCSKSRATLALLEEHGVEPKIVLYLDTPPSKARLTEILGKLGMTPSAFIRRKEKIFSELDLKNAAEDALVDAMVAQPKLIERPIVITPRGAAVGRPPEQVLTVL